jgi:transposase
MEAATTIGVDQVYGIDAQGNVIDRRQLKRRYVLAFFQNVPRCLVGIEAYASPHHRSRQLRVWCVDAAGPRKALQQAPEERCCRRRSNCERNPSHSRGE